MHGISDVSGDPKTRQVNPTQTRGVYTQPDPKPDIQNPKNPRYFHGIQNTEILTNKVDIFF